MRGDILVIENQQAIIDVGRDTFLIPKLVSASFSKDIPKSKCDHWNYQEPVHIKTASKIMASITTERKMELSLS